METGTLEANQDLTTLSSQVEALTEQVQLLNERTAYLAEQARVNEVRRQEWDELKADFTPIMKDLYLVTVEQLAEVEQHVQLENILHLLKRLIRNTRNFERLLDQLESLDDFISDVAPLTDDIFHHAVLQLADMERKGYFGFVKESMTIADNVVTSFTEEDVRLLGDNIVLILNTVKAMTQPEIMNLVNNVTVTYRGLEGETDALDTSMLGLLRQMRDPEVRRGLALTMRMLKAVSQEQPQLPAPTGNGHDSGGSEMSENR